jgi:hypothetical protein
MKSYVGILVCPENLAVLIITRKSFYKSPKCGVFQVILGLLMVLVETFFRDRHHIFPRYMEQLQKI